MRLKKIIESSRASDPHTSEARHENGGATLVQHGPTHSLQLFLTVVARPRASLRVLYVQAAGCVRYLPGIHCWSARGCTESRQSRGRRRGSDAGQDA
eukprot:1133220-Amphidinium_carterae.1